MLYSTYDMEPRGIGVKPQIKARSASEVVGTYRQLSTCRAGLTVDAFLNPYYINLARLSNLRSGFTLT